MKIFHGNAFFKSHVNTHISSGEKVEVLIRYGAYFHVVRLLIQYNYNVYIYIYIYFNTVPQIELKS